MRAVFSVLDRTNWIACANSAAADGCTAERRFIDWKSAKTRWLRLVFAVR
jgi:hypothetical protein